MKKLLLLLLCCLLPLQALADFDMGTITTADGMTLTWYRDPRRNLGGSTALLLIQGCCMDGRYEDAYALNLQLAKAGDTEAMIRLGRHHSTGLGAPQDDAAALAWYIQAADSGNPYAAFDLALAHLNGWGVPADPEAAAVLLEGLAANEDVWPENEQAAQYLAAIGNLGMPLPDALITRPLPYSTDLPADDAMQLGYFWMRGEGGVVDHSEAARWFEKAIELDDNRGVASEWSHAALAAYYRDGTLGAHDVGRALEHAQYLADPWTFAGDMYMQGITAADGAVILAPDTNKALEYYLEGAQNGHPGSLAFVADCCYTGEHMPQDVSKAIDLYLTGMQMGSPRCAQALEDIYLQGGLYEPETLRRLAWTAGNGSPAAEANGFLLTVASDLLYGRTADDGSLLVEGGQFQYAFWILRHLGHQPDPVNAFVHNWLGWFYCGNVPEVQETSYRSALTQYARSAQLGSGYGYAQLGIIFRDGKGVDADVVTARNCFRCAVDLGYPHAQQYLDDMDAE